MAGSTRSIRPKVLPAAAGESIRRPAPAGDHRGVDATTSALNRTSVQPSPPTARLVGLDVARALAVFGMFAAHTMSGGWLFSLVEGRAAALFAVLAGVSIALLSGGSQPYTGDRMRMSRVRIAVRAVLLFVLGLALTSLQTPAMVILSFYGVLFLVSIPLLRVRSTTLAVLAAVFAIGGPLLSFVLRQGIETNMIGYVPSFGDFGSGTGLWTLLHSLLLTGAYPVLTWLPFVLVGMALGRLDLRAVRGRIVVLGAGLGVLGYGASWLAMNVFGVRESLLAILPPGLPPQLLDIVMSSSYGHVPTTSALWLFSSGAHSGTPFEIVGASGVAMAVLGLCLFAERLRGALTPLASVGALALTAYAGHLLALKAFGVKQLQEVMSSGYTYVPWLVLVAVTLVFCTAWRKLLGRGPLEWVLHQASIAPARMSRS
ncbi:MAG: DUF418 domain-containing protein [Saccharopolyspora sp.]|nr:DUF418 domain-containing protein [Saccharopolyspora sp.]